MTLTLVFALAAGMACHPVTGDRITGKELAAAVPELRSLPAGESMAFAPAVGAKKVFNVDELTRIARAHSIAATPAASVCFELPAAPLDRAKVEEAVRVALQPSDVAFQVMETSSQPVPEGEIVFPRGGVSTAPTANNAPVTWRGYVLYQGDRRFDIWARVKLGPPEVQKGDLIHVVAHNGAAKLALDATAQGPGRLGDRIAVKNPTSGKVFTATVAGRGRAVVELSGGGE